MSESIVLYGIGNCDTIRKTRRWLADERVLYAFHDYRKHGIDAALATQMLQALPLTELINMRGTTWRNLPAPARAELSQQTAMALMLDHPAVIRRPLLRIGQRWIAGYDEDRIKALITLN